MSSTAGVPPYVLENKGTFPAPYTLTVPASLEIRPDTATARFDGTGASGSFLACLTFYGTDGERLGRYFNPNPVAAGAVAEVTFTPPFGSAASSTTGGGGIQFDTDNEGGYLDVQTNATDPNGVGMSLLDGSGGGLNIDAISAPIKIGVNDLAASQVLIGNNNVGQVDLKAGSTADGHSEINMDQYGDISGGVSAGNFILWQAGAGATLVRLDDATGEALIEGKTSVTLAPNSGPAVVLTRPGGVVHIGFFGAAPVVPQASGGTTAGVIAGLIALGLFSS